MAETLEKAPMLPSVRVAELRPQLGGRRKAAILMVLLGDEAASEIYKVLEEEEVRLLTREIAELGMVAPETALGILEEYRRLTVTQEYLARGGPEYAAQLLVRAFGESNAKQLLEEVTRSQEASNANLDSLQAADPVQLVKFVEGEHPQTIALILSHLGMKAASAMLLLLPEKLRAEAIRRLAEMREFSPDMVKKIALSLHKRLSGVAKDNRRAYGGVHAAAEMLNKLGQESSREILESIDKYDGALASSIRDHMFTFDHLAGVPEAGIREIVAQAEKKTLGMALKGAPESLTACFFKCMSSRAIDMLKEDIEALGPVRVSQVQQAQQEIVALARKLEADGKIVLKVSGEDAYVA